LNVQWICANPVGLAVLFIAVVTLLRLAVLFAAVVSISAKVNKLGRSID
jgi:hypothetical protein